MILTNCICKSTNEIHMVKHDGNLKKFGKLHLQTMIYMVKYYKLEQSPLNNNFVTYRTAIAKLSRGQKGQFIQHTSQFIWVVIQSKINLLARFIHEIFCIWVSSKHFKNCLSLISILISMKGFFYKSTKFY